MGKMTPRERDIRELMKPGRLTRDGMLGDDPRAIEEIVAADAAALEALGVTRAALAARMRAVTEFARAQLGDPALFEDRLEVQATETRGGILCPFQHPGRFPKCVVTARDVKTGEEALWSWLSLHMIEQHGFFEGVGSVFRVDPERTARILGLTPD